ncbi:MAG: hypothetical protein ACHQYQ_04940 [Bacteriovoracales bacterium]
MNLIKYFLIFSIIYFFNAFANHFQIRNSDNEILIKDYWYQKSRFFTELMDEKLLFLKPNSDQTAIGVHDNARSLVDSNINPLFTSVKEIHEKGLSSSHLDFDYWTGYFWPMARGSLGGRLSDMKFLKQGSWKKKMEYVKSNPPPTYVPTKIHLLSPSEKYELLIGDSANVLTSFMWQRGQETMDKHGQIFSWIGLCDGMAIAAINLPRPKKAVTLWSIDGKNQIKFYPEDIKALGTLLWTQGKFPLLIIGQRCDDSTLRVSPNGRYSQPECIDTNPGTFHLSLANQIGRAKRSFLMDSVASWEIWNSPILGYEFKYFNPQTFDHSAPTETPTGAIIPIGEFTNDKFPNTRSPNTAFVVGVEAKVNILKDRFPTFLDFEGPEDNVSSTETFKYDLELDQNGNIIGGEWYTQEHPDFLWNAPKGIMAKGDFDDELKGNWDPKKELFPQAWVEPAIRSSKLGVVPHQIVKALFELSNQEGEGFNPN